jgi:hypothetical protein
MLLPLSSDRMTGFVSAQRTAFDAELCVCCICPLQRRMHRLIQQYFSLIVPVSTAAKRCRLRSLQGLHFGTAKLCFRDNVFGVSSVVSDAPLLVIWKRNLWLTCLVINIVKLCKFRDEENLILT